MDINNLANVIGMAMAATAIISSVLGIAIGYGAGIREYRQLVERLSDAIEEANRIHCDIEEAAYLEEAARQEDEDDAAN